LILYEHPSSGNCLKARVMLDQVGADYERVELDLFAGETRTLEHFARNPDGRIPVLELDSGEYLAESGAILLYLAEGTEFLPADPLARAQVHAWMFFEQNQVEANIGVARFLALSGRADSVPEVFADRRRRGGDALATLERGLGDRDFVLGDAYSVADLALYGYVHVADDAGVPLAEHPAVSAWVQRVAALPGFEEGLTPMPAHARDRRLERVSGRSASCAAGR
jgi:glutathione S-transferase